MGTKEIFLHEEEIKRVLLRCGIYPSKKGFTYLVASVCYFRAQGLGVCTIYEKVANLFGVKASNVERCIRTCLVESALRGNLIKLNQLFNMEVISEADYVSNGDFIGIVGTYLDFLCKT